MEPKSSIIRTDIFMTMIPAENVKYAMKPEEMIQLMNQYVYLNLNSQYLDSLDYNNASYLFHRNRRFSG